MSIRHVSFLEEAIRQGEAKLLASGALAVETGKFTGRAASSRFVVKDHLTEASVDWGDVNKALPAEQAAGFFSSLEKRLAERPTYKVRGFVGPYPLEVVTTSAWHAAFADNMFRSEPVMSLVEQTRHQIAGSQQPIRIFHDPMTPASTYGLTSPEDAIILLDPNGMRVGIAGTRYAGEIKKSAFSMANYLLPVTGVLPMHSSANCREDGTGSCVIFGLSGTGKTTLSAQAGRHLVGDDEIVWSKKGLSNLEGGCYAKLVNLTAESEPDIFRATQSFGAIMENVVYDSETRVPDFFDVSRTENTRGSYKLEALSRVFNQTIEAKQPESVVFLTADAFGALPAVARLDDWQMRYHFMSGFTAKVAGTEIGLKEPKAAFSACFGAPFMPRAASVYANLLAERVAAAGARVYLLNTGWRGGYAQGGKRFPLAITRRLLEMIQTGELDDAKMTKHPIFGFDVPTSAKGIDFEILRSPEGEQVEQLARLFVQNQAKFKDEHALEICARGGPSLGESTSGGGGSKARASSINARA